MTGCERSSGVKLARRRHGGAHTPCIATRGMLKRNTGYGTIMAAWGERIGDIWGERTPFGAGSEWPERVDWNIAVPEGEVESWKPSACVLCSNGCGLEIAVKDGRIVGVRGRADDPGISNRRNRDGGLNRRKLAR
jgi:anaerobic selenocysteine-containing dehydrogenase